MANLTFAQYIETTLSYLNEDRDSPSTNRKVREDDVKRAINAARRRMIRKVGVGLYRTSATMDATAGEIEAPADFFNDAVIRYAANSTTRTVLTPISEREMDQRNAGWQIAQTGIPNSFVYRETTDGTLTIQLWPPISTTIEDGLLWSYAAMPDDLVDDDDECPVMNRFPEFQVTTLQAGAGAILSLLEGGTADEQYVKFLNIFESDVSDMRGVTNRNFIAPNGGR